MLVYVSIRRTQRVWMNPDRKIDGKYFRQMDDKSYSKFIYFYTKHVNWSLWNNKIRIVMIERCTNFVQLNSPLIIMSRSIKRKIEHRKNIPYYFFVLPLIPYLTYLLWSQFKDPRFTAVIIPVIPLLKFRYDNPIGTNGMSQFR